MKKTGWKGQPARHSLAARGVRTKRVGRGAAKPNSARQYVSALKTLMQPHGNQSEFYNFVLEHGVEFKSRPRPAELPGDLESCDYKTRECFYNAQVLALTRGYRYFEGYATSIIPTEHAWVVTDEGVLLDLTWDKIDSNELDYFGVEIPHRFIAEQMAETKMASSLLQKYWRETK